MSATPRPPFKVIFLHIPKTAGTTLRNMFRQRYPDAVYAQDFVHRRTEYLRFVSEEIDSFYAAPDANLDNLGQWSELSPREQQRFDVFLGHFWYGAHEHLPGPAQYVTMLRDPIDRVLSLHAHRVAVHGLTVPVERYITSEREYEISNGQTRRLSTRGVGEHIGDVTETMFDVACERLAGFAAVGVTERFDESVIALADALGWRNAAYEAANRSEGRTTRDELPRAVLDQLIERNEFDLRLHAFASDQLDKHLVGLDVPAELQRLERAIRLERYRKEVKARLYEAKVVGSKVKRAALRLTKR